LSGSTNSFSRVFVLMGLVFHQATEIGKAVNVLRKHGSKQIRYLARTLIEYVLVSCAVQQLLCALMDNKVVVVVVVCCYVLNN
jgi:hypothetical protein